MSLIFIYFVGNDYACNIMVGGRWLVLDANAGRSLDLGDIKSLESRDSEDRGQFWEVPSVVKSS